MVARWAVTIPLILLTVGPVAGQPILQGSSSDDWWFGWKYVRSEVFQRWVDAYSPDGPPVLVDAENMSAPDVLYLPDRDVFVVCGTSEVSVGPGRVEVSTAADGFRESTSLDVRGPAVVDAWPDLVAALLDDTVCELRILREGQMPPYEAVIRKGEREVARETLDMEDMLREVVEYAVYPDRVVFRVLGRPVPKSLNPSSPPNRVIVYTITFLPREGRILVSRTVSRDPRLLYRLAQFASTYSPTVQVGVLKTPSGALPLFARFQPPWEDPIIEAVDRAVLAWRNADEAELREVLREHPNVRLPEPWWRRSGGNSVWTPLPPFAPVRPGRRRLRRLAALVLLALPLAVAPASATTVTGGALGDYQLLHECRERALQELTGGAHVTVYVNPSGRSYTCTYRPEDGSFVVGPSSRLSPWDAIQPKLPDPAVISVGKYLSSYLVYHAGRTYLVAPVTDLGPVVYVLEGDSVRAYLAPEWVSTLVGRTRWADATFELSGRGCTLRYYLIRDEDVVELTVRIDFSAERPEFWGRVVSDPRAIKEIEERAERVERLSGRVGGVVMHSLEGTRPVLVTFELPEDHPLRRFIDEGIDIATDPVNTSMSRLLSWWFEWKRRFPNVELLPDPSDPTAGTLCAVLREPWLAIVPDLLTAVCALPLDLALTTLERRLYDALEPRVEPWIRDPLGRFLAAVAYYVPVGLLEELLGRLLMPPVVRSAVIPVLPVVGLRVPEWDVDEDVKELSERALYCAVAPVVDTVAMHRVAELVGSPVIAAFTYALLDTLWKDRGRWLDVGYWLAFPVTILLPAIGGSVFSLLWSSLPQPLAALLYGLRNTRILTSPPAVVPGSVHRLVQVLTAVALWTPLGAPT
ncbi:hypothetical protein [Methanopyrus kandleri]|uniref:Uncharacterized protein specific for M.kandleri, contains two domains of the MK-3 family n=1 Tax=Methanopyrus kandleri (strain AV19 / DSM 6324 / JCM 9639 / NBRC 100938) TaxID=190192 RepID=Q8TVP9_METKA|nr:hypothetical protein [Methanopyrus kandleri]AAM02552.1 Uncharacterized protein specific for M.kandleri, contains two domains of the MK-3 family [Methanopyrus kandleri AV19]